MKWLTNFLNSFWVSGNITGNNNKVIGVRNNNIFYIYRKHKDTKIKINGENNEIIINYDNVHGKIKVVLPKRVNLSITGNNNKIHIDMPIRFSHSSIILKGDGNTFKIGQTKHTVSNAIFCSCDGGNIIIGKDCQMIAGGLFLKIEDDGNVKHRIEIGDGTNIARECIIRASDGHTLYDPETHLPLNPPDDIIIGKHCWITSRCTLIKGTVLPDNTVVGANSLVNKKFTEEHTMIAGSPAKIIRRNVFWDERGFARYSSDIKNKIIVLGKK